MKVNGKTIKKMDLESCMINIRDGMKDNGRMTGIMVLERKHRLLVQNIMVNGGITKSMDLENIFIVMETNMKVNG